MAKQSKNQLPKNNQGEIAQEMNPAAEQEFAEKISYQAPAKGMNKKQQQQEQQQ